MDNVEYNEQVLQNAYDPSGHRTEVKCPNCTAKASYREYDELLGGCINQVYKIDCDECGYHECNAEICSRCESEYDELLEPEPETEMVDAYYIYQTFERILICKPFDPFQFMSLKQFIFNQPDSVGWCELLFVDRPNTVPSFETPSDLIDHLKGLISRYYSNQSSDCA